MLNRSFPYLEIVKDALECIVIDDDKNIKDMLSEILELYGFSVKGTGSNGQEGITIFESKRPEIVFMDVRMPKMNGIDALKKIKQIDPKVKVVMVTADSSSELEKTLLDAGALKVIFKPFTIQDIRKVLDKIVANSTVINHAYR